MKQMSAFDFFLRTGRRITHEPQPIATKFNPWHDPDDGRFTFAEQGRHFPKKTGPASSSTAAKWRTGGHMPSQEIERRAINAKRMYDIHRARGMTPEQAAGWAANAEAESRSNYREHQDGGGPGRGLFQWGDGYREKLFEERYGHTISKSTEDEQLNFRDWELSNNGIRAANRISKAKSAGDIAAAIAIHYERPDDKVRTPKDRANIAEAILRRANKGR